MRKLILTYWQVIALGCISTSLFANESLDKIKSYKCYVQLADETKVVRYWNSSSMSLKQVKATALGYKTVNKNGVKKKITQVIQCLPRDRDFVDVKAREIEKSQVG